MASSRSPALPLLGFAVLAILAAVWLFQDDAADPAHEPAPATESQPEADVSGTAPDALVADGQRDEPEQLDARADALPVVEPREPWPDESVLVRGRVVDTDDQPQVDVDVNLFDAFGEYSDTELTEEDGSFEFLWDEPLTAGWSLATGPDAYADPDDPFSLAPTTKKIAKAWHPGEPALEVELVLHRAPRLAGRVIDARTSLPIEFADVEVVSQDPAWVDEFQDAFTEEDGTFEMSLVDLPRTGILVRVMDDDGRSSTVGPLDLAPSEVRFLEIELSGGTDVAGHVRDLQGSPVDGAEVVLLPLHPDLDDDFWDITLEDGTFLFEDVGGNTQDILIYAQADGHGPVILPLGEVAGPVEIVLGQLSSVAGTVIDARTGEAVEGADLTFTLRGPGGLNEDYEDYGFSEDKGRFRLDLEYVPIQAASLRVESVDHVLFTAEVPTLVDVDTGALFFEFNIALEPLP